ncbi:hypothetical protein FA95DRAFT_1471485, partial [Auriscalpium vulgare]
DDDEAMNAARRALRQKRNSLLPVARLPPETLRHIFAFCSDNDYPLMENRRSNHMGWLAVTHTCRRWRDVALEHSGLWARISYRLNRAWTYAFAERAQTMPLAV